MSGPVGLLDTSVFIARESGRPVDAASLPAEYEVSVVTVAELIAGVLIAADTDVRARRLTTLNRVIRQRALPIDEPVAAQWPRLQVHLAAGSRRVPVNDLWIAATAIVHQLPVVTQDDDFDPLDGYAGLEIVKI